MNTEPRTWSLPHEPGPEVTTVRCDCHGLRWRLVYAPPVSAWAPEADPMTRDPMPWHRLFAGHVSFTDATGDTNA